MKTNPAIISSKTMLPNHGTRFCMPLRKRTTVCLGIAFVFLFASVLLETNAIAQSRKAKRREAVEKTFGDPPGMIRLGDTDQRVWFDQKKRRVAVDGYIALRQGQLEMFACPEGTKEHESIVAVMATSETVHAALLAAGAETGTPVQWNPEYRPPTGSEIAVSVLWRDSDGTKKTADSRDWIRKVGTDSDTLDVNFVFAGSIFYVDPETGEYQYQANSGDLICVSNFTTATLDVPLNSLDSNSALMFATYTERIPPEDTPVRLILQVVQPKDKAADKKPADEKPASDKASPATDKDAKAVDKPPEKQSPSPEDQLSLPKK